MKIYGMSQLSKNWITEKHIDFEFKKYMLLAYLQEVDAHFQLTKLYPSLAELVEHYRTVKSIKANKENLLGSFSDRMKKIDTQSFQIIYEKIITDDSLMKEIESILDFSIPKFENHINEGRKIYDFVEEHMNIFPVGVLPLNPSEGYIFLKETNGSKTTVYEFHITIFEQPGEKFRGIHTQFVKSYSNSFIHTFESIKTDLIRENKTMPNPAAFAVETEIQVPIEETFLPIAKRAVVRYVSTIK